MEAIRKVEQCAHHVMALLENADWRMTTSSHVGFLMQGIQSTRTSSKCYATLLRRAKAPFHGWERLRLLEARRLRMGLNIESALLSWPASRPKRRSAFQWHRSAKPGV